MTAGKKSEGEKDRILEEMLRSLKSIGQNVERIVDGVDIYSTHARREYDDEWKTEDLYDNGEY
jgi:hypothetical protein